MNLFNAFAAAFVSALLCVMATGCSGNSDAVSAVARANSRCPIPIENVGFVSAISLSGDTLVYDCMVTEAGIDLAALAGHTAEMKRAMQPSIATLFDTDPGLLEKLRADRLTLSVRYHDAAGHWLSVEFHPDELAADAADKEKSEPLDPERRLADELALTAAGLPAEMVPGITIVEVADTLGYVEFRCSVDETGLHAGALDSLKTHAAEIRHNMSQALLSEGDPAVDRMVDITLSARRGLRYRYTGSRTGDTLSIAFAPSELVR